MSSLGVSYLQEAGKASGNFVTGTFGKMLGGAAGLLLIVKLVTESFYVVPVGFRGVKMRGDQPIRKREWRRLGLIALRCGPRTGPYKTKRRGVGMKIPFYHTVRLVNIQNRVQQLAEFDADCPDGQRHVNAQLITRIPCEADGPEFADYPARSIIYSSEADDMFESDGGTALLDILESAKAEKRNDKKWLRDKLNEQVGDEFDRCGYELLRVNLRARALTPIQKAIDAFAPKPAEPESDKTKDIEEEDNVFTLPHPVVMTAALTDVANNS